MFFSCFKCGGEQDSDSLSSAGSDSDDEDDEDGGDESGWFYYGKNNNKWSLTKFFNGLFFNRLMT